MFESLSCMALRTIKYDDRRSIVSVWTRQRGRLGFLVPAGSSREAVRRRAIMMPLGLFDCEADIRPGLELFNIRDVRPRAVLPSLTDSPQKVVVAMFLAEVLEKILRDAPPDPILSDFLFDAVLTLDSMNQRGVANFPIVFLCRLSAFFGIEPDLARWTPGCVFDMADGIYRSSAPASGRWLTPDETKAAAIIQRLSFDSARRFGLPRDARRKILDVILEYYSLHLTRLDSLRSLDVARSLF